MVDLDSARRAIKEHALPLFMEAAVLATLGYMFPGLGFFVGALWVIVLALSLFQWLPATRTLSLPWIIPLVSAAVGAGLLLGRYSVTQSFTTVANREIQELAASDKGSNLPWLKARRLTDEQQKKLIDVLSTKDNCKIKIRINSGTEESYSYAYDFRNVFERAGWQVNWTPQPWDNTTTYSAEIKITEWAHNPWANKFKAALREADVPFGFDELKEHSREAQISASPGGSAPSPTPFLTPTPLPCRIVLLTVGRLPIE